MPLSPTLAAVRFGTGLSPAHAAPQDAGAVLARLQGTDAMAARYPQPAWAEKAAMVRRWAEARRARNDGSDASATAYRQINRQMFRDYHADLGRIVARGAMTDDGLRERLQWFWCDHFTVTDGGGLLRRSVAAYHEEAIRPHLTGRFADLLQAAVMHPAMLIYLDQARSVGPNSPRGRQGAGLNENLAREILELHTLGVEGPYGQRDVTQLAELLTGLSVRHDGTPVFRGLFVEPGAEEVLGLSYGGARPDEGAIRQVLSDLSVHPATARHLCTKLVRHFESDVPDADMVAAMTRRWIETDGDLLAVYAVMLDHPAASDRALRKVRRPLEFIVAGARALGMGADLPEAGNRIVRDFVLTPLQLMGQRWQRAPGPDGWPEAAEAWITPQTLAARIEWAMSVAASLPEPPDPRAFLETALADLAGPRSRFAAAAAESRAAGVGLILSSPEFQRR
ncbi:DUF1800 family protein [Jannaschia sp. 2305UL9-9]|uniref:DUF1800 domain-containing protein n=1 Tax=Jannaschia sp. 2305UL9-9 TaxID=3121638 RepID=UPI00352813C7